MISFGWLLPQANHFFVFLGVEVLLELAEQLLGRFVLLADGH
jgi:hypothetical protein